MERFARQMYELENRMNFVGYSMLCNQWMLDWELDWNEHECRRLIDEYQQTGILEPHEVYNPDWPTSAVRLVRNDERVRQALGFSDGPMSDPVLTSQPGRRAAWPSGWTGLDFAANRYPQSR